MRPQWPAVVVWLVLMAVMARTLVEHGVWGIRPDEFVSASSSPLWTLLLAGCFSVVGPLECVPLVLNLVLSFAVLWLLDAFPKRRGLGSRRRILVLLIAAFAAPLPALIAGGMEHILQIVNDIGAIAWASDTRLLDIIGLATPEIAVLRRRSGCYDAHTLDELASRYDVSFAIAYERWLRDIGIPDRWAKIGEWTMDDNAVCGDATVAFFPIDPNVSPILRERLRAHALPVGVTLRLESEER